MLDTTDLKEFAERLNPAGEASARWGIRDEHVHFISERLDLMIFKGLLSQDDFLPNRWQEQSPQVRARFALAEEFNPPHVPGPGSPYYRPAPGQPIRIVEVPAAGNPPPPPPAPKPVLPICEVLAATFDGRKTDQEVTALAFQELGGQVEKATLTSALQGMKTSGLLATLQGR